MTAEKVGGFRWVPQGSTRAPATGYARRVGDPKGILLPPCAGSVGIVVLSTLRFLGFRKEKNRNGYLGSDDRQLRIYIPC